ncbi:MAG: amidase [Acidobacteriota bacterium]
MTDRRPTRRHVLAGLAAAGLAAGAGSTCGDSAENSPTDLDTRDTEGLLGLDMTESERELMREDLTDARDDYEVLRGVDLPNALAPALVFSPLDEPPRTPQGPDRAGDEPRRPDSPDATSSALADDDPSALAFAPAHQLAAELRAGRRTSVELTQLYLERLATYDPLLECVVTRTKERALDEAERADRALRDGDATSPLHGVPWGAKDLLAARGYTTTWGATPFRTQQLDTDATAVARLTDAGAPLVAKLTLGALAWGDVWFDGTTRNPWNPEQGSSGSSAGSAAAVAAGLVGFALGSETWGSIVSPCTRTGCTGLRPSFGHVSRHGAMALSWSMDKLGPIARTVDDCALVLEAIHGPDGHDRSVRPDTFRWRRDLDPTRLRVGVVRTAFDEEREDTTWRAHDLAVLETLEYLGLDLVEIELPTRGPDALPIDPLGLILSAEAAAAFDAFSRSGRDDELVRQGRQAWPNVFRHARFIPAVEYLQANRVRTLFMERMAELMTTIDVFVCPSFGADNLLLTNLTGHPAVVVPNGFRDDGTPTSITFTGRLFGENELLAVARAYQQATDHHLQRPPIDRFLAERTENDADRSTGR